MSAFLHAVGVLLICSGALSLVAADSSIHEILAVLQGIGGCVLLGLGSLLKVLRKLVVGGGISTREPLESSVKYTRPE